MVLSNSFSNDTHSPRQIYWDLILFAVLFLLSIYFVYFSNQSISRIFFLGLLFLFLLSKKDYFWFAYFFILTQGPGYFFSDFSGASLRRLPLYTFLPGMSLTPIDLFVLFALLKAFDRGRKMGLELKIPLLVLLAYVILDVGLGTVIYGTSVEVIAWNLRWVFCYSIILSFLYLVNQKNSIYRFILLTSPMVFLILFTQIYYVATGNEFINLFNPGFRGIALNTATGELRPVVGGGLLVFFNFISSILLLEEKHSQIPKLYLYSVIGVAFLSIFLSATRLWFVIFTVILVGYTLVSGRKLRSALAFLSISFLVISVLVYSGLISQDFLIESSWGRLKQVFSIAGGDVNSVDNAMNRIVNQLPVILGVMKQNLLFGFGFSRYTMFFYDNDLGFVNTILMFGLVGFALLIFFFARVFMMLSATLKVISARNPTGISLKVMILVWVGLLIGYLTTWDFFTMSFYKVFFVAVLIALSEFFVVQARNEEVYLR